MNTPKKKKRYTRGQLRDAIFAVHGSASKRDAAKEFGVTFTILIRRLRNSIPGPVGNPTAFTQDEKALFWGAETSDVMCQAVVPHRILLYLFSVFG